MKTESLSHYFLALPVADNAKNILDAWAGNLKDQLQYGHWTHREDYHTTLAFLGPATSEKIADLDERLNSLRMVNFSLSLNGLGTFGKPNRPSVLWGAVTAGDKLYNCQKAVADVCGQAGFSMEKRAYKPHITIAKKWRGDKDVSLKEINEWVDIEQKASWDVNEIVLFETVLNKIPRYKPVRHYSLSQ